MVVADTPRGLMVLPKEKPERPGRVERERKKKLEEDERRKPHAERLSKRRRIYCVNPGLVTC